MPAKPVRGKRKIAAALNEARITSDDFSLSEPVKKEIRRRDEVEREARKKRIRVG